MILSFMIQLFIAEHMDFRGKLRVSLKNVQFGNRMSRFHDPMWPRKETTDPTAAESVPDATAMFATHSILGLRRP